MDGYFNDPESTEAIIANGWLWTGDLGYFADNQLYITGRAKDLIIVRGRNLYAEDIERTAERVEGVRPSGVVAFGVYDDEEPGTIPKTPSGKRQRSLCKEMYLRDALKPTKLGKVQLGIMVARSKAGMLLMRAKGLLRRD